MTPGELSRRVGEITAEAQSRVGPGSIGAQQYYVPGQPQKFETMSRLALLDYFRDEMLDAINYAVMFILRLDQLKDALSDMEHIE